MRASVAPAHAPDWNPGGRLGCGTRTLGEAAPLPGTEAIGHEWPAAAG